jgi:hypothetical protein
MSTAIYTEEEVRELPFDLLSDELIEQEVEKLVADPRMGEMTVYASADIPLRCRCNLNSGSSCSIAGYYIPSCPM